MNGRKKTSVLPYNTTIQFLSWYAEPWLDDQTSQKSLEPILPERINGMVEWWNGDRQKMFLVLLVKRLTRVSSDLIVATAIAANFVKAEAEMSRGTFRALHSNLAFKSSEDPGSSRIVSPYHLGQQFIP